jgi:cytoskeletal protein RodZ
VHRAAQGYGNIYTPHAGSMVIQVQRELGLANRTIVLSPRKVRLLRFFTSKVGKALAIVLGLSWIVLAVMALRVPLLKTRLQNLEHTAQRLDTLETTLSRLQYRYNQVHRLLGPSSAPPPAATAAAPAATPAATPTPATGTTSPAATPVTAQAQVPVATPAQPAPRKQIQGPKYAAPIQQPPASSAPAKPAVVTPAPVRDSTSMSKTVVPQ